MRYLTFILLFLIVSCGVETEIHQCNDDIADYTDFRYEILDKKFVKSVNNDSLFKAEILIEKHTKDSLILLDSVLCYCLAICIKESIIESRFYKNRDGFEVVKKYGIKKFKASELNSIITNSNDLKILWSAAIASFKIEEPDGNWEKHINSDNISTMTPRVIQPRFKKKINKKLQIE